MSVAGRTPEWPFRSTWAKCPCVHSQNFKLFASSCKLSGHRRTWNLQSSISIRTSRFHIQHQITQFGRSVVEMGKQVGTVGVDLLIVPKGDLTIGLAALELSKGDKASSPMLNGHYARWQLILLRLRHHHRGQRSTLWHGTCVTAGAIHAVSPPEPSMRPSEYGATSWGGSWSHRRLEASDTDEDTIPKLEDTNCSRSFTRSITASKAPCWRALETRFTQTLKSSTVQVEELGCNCFGDACAVILATFSKFDAQPSAPVWVRSGCRKSTYWLLTMLCWIPQLQTRLTIHTRT